MGIEWNSSNRERNTKQTLKLEKKKDIESDQWDSDE
jgi:hypothetical protein